MRIETAPLSQSLVESSKPVDKKEVTSGSVSQDASLDDSQSFIPSPLGSSGTYSVRSLKSAVDHYAKFLTVAESNMRAIQLPATFPQVILDRLKGNG
jgi:hypothetical protein